MDAPESSRNHSKRFMEERLEIRERRNDDDDGDRESDKRKNRSTKSRRHGTPEEPEEHDGGRRNSGGDKHDGRKRSGSSSRAGSEEEHDYESRRDNRSKVARVDQDCRGEKKSSKGYGEESSRKNRDDDSEWVSSSRKAIGRPPEHENFPNKTRNKGEGSFEGERERMDDKDSRYSERTVNIRENDEERIPNPRMFEETEAGRKGKEGGNLERSDARSGKSSDCHKHGTSRDWSSDSRNEPGESRGRAVDFVSDKGVRPSNREDNREDGERNSSRRGRQASHDEDSRHVSVPRETRLDATRDDKKRKMHDESPGFVEDAEHNINKYSSRPHGERDEKHRPQSNCGHAGLDDVEICERSINADEEGHAPLRVRSRGEVNHDGRSRSPERNERHNRDPDDRNRGYTESDNDRSTGIRGKEWDDSFGDDKNFKGREGSWTDKNRERDDSKDHWGRNQTRQDTKEWDNRYDRNKERDPPRREQERIESEKLHTHPGYRRDARGRLDGRISSSHRNDSDSIEIKPNVNFDFAREGVGTGRRNETGSQQNFSTGDEEWGYPLDDRRKVEPNYDDDLHDRYNEDVSSTEQNSGRYSLDSQSGRGRGPKGAFIPNRPWVVQGPGNGLQPLFGNNQMMGAFNRAPHQGPKGGRIARGGKGRLNGRDVQRVGMQLPPIIGPPFGHIGLPGPMQQLVPNIPHAPGPSIGPGVFIPPFTGPLVWSGPRGVDVNMLATVPHNLPPIPPPGPAGPRFAPNMGSGSNPAMFFNQASPGRGVLPNAVHGFNSASPAGRLTQHEKASGGWTPSRNTGISGKGPSRGEQNDYSQNFVDTGSRPQNFIRELEITNVVEDYPKLRELIQRKDEIVTNSSAPPMYFKCDLREHALSPEFFGTKFDVILVDPPWEEYVHRAPGVTDNIESWTFEEIQNLKIEVIADTPSFIFLWVGDGVGLEQGRQCLKKWGFRRCEDICWVKTNKKAPTSALRHDSHTLFQHSKEHCLMGIKGTVRRSTDGHIIHANIDTDIIIAEESVDASSTKKPDDMYRIVEHFALGRRRLELFGEDHNIRPGWLTVGKGLSSSNFNTEAYVRSFADKDGKVWQGGGGRNPPPDAPHLVLTTPEIESLRPKSPPPKNQQQQVTPLPPSGNSNNRRPASNSPQNLSAVQQSGGNQDASGSEPATPAPWASPMGGLRWQESGHGGVDEKFSDGYSFNAPFLQVVGDRIEFDPHRALNIS